MEGAGERMQAGKCCVKAADQECRSDVETGGRDEREMGSDGSSGGNSSG